MKIISFILPVITVSLLTGCAATRTISDVVMGAGGAALANKLSDGDPVAIAGGAAAGVLVSEGLHYAAKSQAEKAYNAGYNRGRSDTVKQQYWLYVSKQEQVNARNHRVQLYPVQLPEQVIDGVIFQPTTQLLRIEE